MTNSDFEEKAFIDVFLQRIKEILGLYQFRPMLNNMVSEQYNNAVEEVDSQLNLNINLIPSEKDIRFLQKYVDENVTDAGDQIANELRQEIQRGIMNGDTKKDLIKRVKIMFRDKKYSKRLKVILRTETSRANNMGTLQGAKQASETGLKLRKWLDVSIDDRTSNICSKEHSKYGSPDKSISLDEDFIVKADNKTIKAQSPPFHPNCRTVLRIKTV